MQRGLQHWAKLHNVIKNGEEVPPSFRQPHELAEENRIPLSPIIFPSIVRHLLIQFAHFLGFVRTISKTDMCFGYTLTTSIR